MDNCINEQQKPVVKRRLTDQEKRSISRFNQREGASGSIFHATCEGNGTLELVLDEKLERSEAVNLVNSRIMEATGAANSTVGLQLLTNLAKAAISSKVKGGDIANQLNTLSQSMQALGPEDEYEGQLVAQLVVLHEQAMSWLGRAMNTDRVDFANVYLNGASKLLTRHHETLEALLKYRRKGEQRVHVEHVHIHGGAQAIVGNVTTGGGMNPKIEEGPHAKV
jgi:hypothetical protein